MEAVARQFTTDRKFAAGVPLRCDESDDFQTIRLGLSGLGKLHNTDRSVSNLSATLDNVIDAANIR